MSYFPYLMGLATADGFLYRERSGNPTVRFMGTDLQHMDRVAKEIGGNRKLMKRGVNWPEHYKTCYSTQKTGDLARAMIERGVSENRKSYNQGPISLEEGELGGFLRGFTDGDGHVGKGKNGRGVLSYTGGEALLRWVKALLESQGGKVSLYDMRERKGWAWVQVQGSGASIWPALRVIYPEGDYLTLERKKEAAHAILRHAG